jgi:uncharacterized protein (DUF3820 family)
MADMVDGLAIEKSARCFPLPARRASRSTLQGMKNFTEIDREDFRNLLVEIGKTRIPFGKFGIKAYPPAGVPIMDLPIEYLVWFHERGFPKGRLGELMAQVYEIKAVGMDSVFDPLRQAQGGRFRLQPTRRRSFGFE